ncbi:hypothetical protein [Shewanella sp. KCT]|uniref:hypothetical protein n=1 Tax=Shewanella sp. KCT TaxID=2569535 RepID=UPI0011833E3C|nr:hypothetical protein [Shewanella sp. KCT]TVP11783.1 hypothetical protein AYI87_15240 [Shewanella sp. KCT]
MKATVFRVQDKRGRGPFQPGFTAKWLQQHKELPPYYLEFDIDVRAEQAMGNVLGCACRDLEQLKKWFTEQEFKTLQKLGFKAVRLEVDRIIESSDIQCVFSRARQLRKGAVEVKLY